MNPEFLRTRLSKILSLVNKPNFGPNPVFFLHQNLDFLLKFWWTKKSFVEQKQNFGQKRPLLDRNFYKLEISNKSNIFLDG